MRVNRNKANIMITSKDSGTHRTKLKRGKIKGQLYPGRNNWGKWRLRR